MNFKLLTFTMAVGIVLAGCGNEDEVTTADKAALGASFYQDETLSLNGTMSCATCHAPEHGLVDPRTTNNTLGASLGDDGVSIGDRNTPSAGYAAFSPDFHFDEEEGLFIGGQFLDGRAKGLKEQAKGPFLNPLEMGMPDVASVIAKVRENPAYLLEMQRIYGPGIFEDDSKAFDAVAESIAVFERSDDFSPFDSKFDRYLAGTYTLNAQEERGMAIFSDESETPGAGRCTLCHPIDGEKPLMTDFSYDNLGVPVNHALRTANGQAGNNDLGLFGNDDVNDTDLKGAFKVSSLRNVAVTAPYMHNGVFKNLKTVVHFYNSRDVAGAINPETGTAWEEGEFHAGRNVDELGNLGLSDQDEEDIVAFLKTFTDKRFEHLLE